ncbi:hypothetical protein CLV57_0995 [Mucilaginibacter auburnensis]|uniref:Uncharacterized protein n=1 Tax=Mucilaginibacter auburnensis TaxID=1457233 RepID=A0A2H9VT40_9SPHI|nr:hypothetical protein CLV57_0995 [Mucilaginibacter auburnensis]
MRAGSGKIDIGANPPKVLLISYRFSKKKPFPVKERLNIIIICF